ncbi:MAG: hypothetical protein JNL01_02315 [Bdellovibrionales bacterium]|nr:hypothetical protein [Bdellovibrionales bacterium]
MKNWETWGETPIQFLPVTPSRDELRLIQEGATVAELFETDRVRLDHTYLKLGLKGTLKKVYTRKVILDRLTEGANQLPPGYSVMVFDAFRTIECQYDLLRWMAEDAKRRNPKLSTEESWAVSRMFVADPDDKERPTVPTHNSGGAIDLGLCYQGQLVNYGTDFDEPVEKSNTLALEKALEAGKLSTSDQEALRNRRQLFYFMKSLGFTNLSSEWWHYDIGDLLWSRQTGYPKMGHKWIFESIEKEVLALK